MSANEKKITKDTTVDISNDAEVEAVAALMHAELGFSEPSCQIALHLYEGHVGNAAEHLASGGWMGGQCSVSWNWDVLTPACEKLVAETGLPEHQCLKVLQDCAGNEVLAARKLAGLLAMP